MWCTCVLMCVFGIYEQSVGEGERVSPVRGFRGQASQISSKVGMLGWGVALKVTCSLKLFDWSVRVEPWSPQAHLCMLYVFLGIYGQSQSLRTIFLSDELDAAFATSNCLNKSGKQQRQKSLNLIDAIIFLLPCLDPSVCTYCAVSQGASPGWSYW